MAVNPWVQLARVLFERTKHNKSDKKAYKEFADYAKYANGLISCDGLKTQGYTEAKPVIWFLNLASAYQDMAMEQKLDKFHYTFHTPRTYYMLGCRGPFGVVNMKDHNRITFKILTLHKEIRPV